MADDWRMFPFINPRQFSATFLDFQRNSRGYNHEEVNTADIDATKRLLSPFLPKHQLSDSIPQCHPLGNTMWIFAKECATGPCQSRNHSTGLNPPVCRLNSEEDLQATPQEADELSCSSTLPHFASNSAPSACKIPELNKQRHLEDAGPLESEFVNTVGLNEAIKTTSDGTDQNQNTVLSEFSSSYNGGYHFPACGEVCNEAQVYSKLSTTEAVLNFVGNEQLRSQGHQAAILKTEKTLGTSLSDEKSSHFEQHIEPVNFKSETKLITCHAQNDLENNVDIGGGTENKHNHLFTDDGKCIKKYEKNENTEESVASVAYVNDIEERDVTNGQHLCEDLLAITEKKNLRKNHFTRSVISSRYLCISKEIDATVSVLESEMIGMYDYISGTVHGLQQGFYRDDESESQLQFSRWQYWCSDPVTGYKVPHAIKCRSRFGSRGFLTHLHHILIALSPQTADSGKVLKEHSPVAWLLTSPALGVTLDWQVQEKLLKFVQTLSTDKVNKELDPTMSNKDCFSTQWYNLLVVVDEYRFVEKDIPLVEVYELCPNEEIKLVNFELNYM
ncbi:hypothetical protein OS493_022201 [Desmophyllum pertusum]|uniref:Uncharacterized protein n=1 Tax=Desmophyllum pertusum TaxID=174260 RepID=A0A9W9YE01_9CNID|nr:hypothetical protein OS493_022201 [Desmophyllum pertusum]